MSSKIELQMLMKKIVLMNLKYFYSIGAASICLGSLLQRLA